MTASRCGAVTVAGVCSAPFGLAAATGAGSERMLVRFPNPGSSPTPEQIGGKASALLRLAEAGLPVPPGAVLGSAFFEPWHRALRAAVGAQSSEFADELRSQVAVLPFGAAQQAALDQLLLCLPDDHAARFAVRSSAIGEDGADASFAGQYETRLGVTRDGIGAAIRDCFAASLAPRLRAYRRQRGIAGGAAFAVIVQQQIDSAVAGVGFSLDPLSNDLDHAVIAASWGLGSLVVDGRVDADQFVVDTPTQRILRRRIGAKQSAARLGVDGGVAEIALDPARAAQPSLDDRQVLELTQLLMEVERLFGAPVDIEWAIADGRIHLLQARPITTFVPLPDALQTAPGAQRRLYLDAALSKGMTSNLPFSTLGLQQIERAFLGLVSGWIGGIEPGGEGGDGLIAFAGGRMYLNLSDLLRFASPARLAAGHAATDALTARILASVDAGRYRAKRRPAWFGVSLLWRSPLALWRLRWLFGWLLIGLLHPLSLQRRHDRVTAQLTAQLRGWPAEGQSLEALQQALVGSMRAAFEPLMAALLLGQIPPRLALGRRAAQNAAELDALARGTEGNVVVEMSVALSQLAGLLDAAQFDDLPRLADQLRQRALPAAFLEAWDRFIDRFGCRGPNEMDIASPRYRDDPLLALGPMRAIARGEGAPLQQAQARHVAQREAALVTLQERLGPLRRWLLRRIVRLNTRFAGSRDTPKYINVLAGYVMRRRALQIGQRLQQQGRLDRAEQVFDLRFDDLARADTEPELELRRLAGQRSAFRRRLLAQVRQFPQVIDSRGRILRPPAAPPGDRLLHGTPVSAGLARGPVRVLHGPDGHDIAVGDILVAYTTDPGWTPLFVNAAAIVLEVGGVLQHGAVVAREFGKPCVVGIAGVVTTLHDGEQVEVDGAAGTLRRLDPAAEP